MDDPRFFFAIAFAYGAACATFVVGQWYTGSRWTVSQPPETDRKWLDFAMVFVAAGGVFAIGELYRRGLLLPAFPGVWSGLSTVINLILPFTPLFLVVLGRGQSFDTLMLSRKHIGNKVGFGCLASLTGLCVYLAAMGRLPDLASVLRATITTHSLIHAPAVFMEGVALAFVYDRLRWVSGHVPSILMPGLLFAAAHVPRSIEAGRTVGEIAFWFLFNTALPACILHVVARSRDVIWIAIPHYVLDVAIGAFE